MSATEEILSQVSMPSLARQLGTDEATAREAAEAALPALLAGVTGDAATPQRRDALARAAQADHDPALLEADDPIAGVDETDGNKIVDHVLRDQRNDVEARLQGFLGDNSGSLVSKVLPILAPLVMSWLARKMLGQGGGSGGSGGGLGDILGDVLGGGSGGASSGGSGGGLGDIVGDVLGGGSGGASSGGSGGGLGDIVGDVLGGGSTQQSQPSSQGGELGDILGQLGGKAGGGGGLDDLLGSILGSRAGRGPAEAGPR